MMASIFTNAANTNGNNGNNNTSTSNTGTKAASLSTNKQHHHHHQLYKGGVSSSHNMEIDDEVGLGGNYVQQMVAAHNQQQQQQLVYPNTIPNPLLPNTTGLGNSTNYNVFGSYKPAHPHGNNNGNVLQQQPAMFHGTLNNATTNNNNNFHQYQSLPRTLASLSLPTAMGPEILRNPSTQNFNNTNNTTSTNMNNSYHQTFNNPPNVGSVNARAAAVAAKKNSRENILLQKGSKASRPPVIPSLSNNPSNNINSNNFNTTIGNFSNYHYVSNNNASGGAARQQQTKTGPNFNTFTTTASNNPSDDQSSSSSNTKKYGTNAISTGAVNNNTAGSIRQQQAALRKGKYAALGNNGTSTTAANQPSNSGGESSSSGNNARLQDSKKASLSALNNDNIENSVAGIVAPNSYQRHVNNTSAASGASRNSVCATLNYSSEEALRKYWDRLTSYERVEIANYQTIYCIGKSDCKKINNMDSPSNHGYDDDRGDYKIVMRDHIAYRFEVMEMLGKGSFGQVVRAYDHKHGQMVAVKIIRNKKRFHQQALIEVNDPDDNFNVIHLRNYFYFRDHLCIAFELLSMNLYEFIKYNNFAGCNLALIRRFAQQILQCLCLLRKGRIIHCDLKPENVLLKAPTKSAIKVIDFGSSCFENQKIYTYIQSRFYRSPEVILGIPYSMAIDMWSLGCILAELYTGQPIFPGENEKEQLACIMEIIGVPPPGYISKSTRKDIFFESNGLPRAVSDAKGRKKRPGSTNLRQAINCNDEKFLDYLARCFEWDGEQRLDPFEALQHPFITDTSNSSSSNRFATVKEKSPLEKENANSASVFNYSTFNPGATASSTTTLKNNNNNSGMISSTANNGNNGNPLPPIASIPPPSSRRGAPVSSSHGSNNSSKLAFLYGK